MKKIDPDKKSSFASKHERKMTIVLSEEEGKLVDILNEELGLTLYESKAYIALLLFGPLSPKEVNQTSRVPRPRTYDVLKSLAAKCLVSEQPGRPRMYVALDPRIGLEKMMLELEREMRRQLEEKRKTAKKLSYSLSSLRQVSCSSLQDPSARENNGEHTLCHQS